MQIGFGGLTIRNMVRLTAELIADSPQFTNPVKDRELDLRGNLVSNKCTPDAPPCSPWSILHVMEGNPESYGS